MENCIFKNTGGTAPSDGIDFEPNHFRNKLTNCIVRNCIFDNNQGSGIEVCVTHLSERTENISILVENCRITNCGNFGISIGTITNIGVKGLIEFNNCTVENTGNAGLGMWDTPAGSVRVRFENCKWKNVGLSKEYVKIDIPMSAISGKVRKPPDQGATDFANCYLYGPNDKSFFVRALLEKSYGIHFVNTNGKQ